MYINVYTYISTTDLYIASPHRWVQHIQKIFVKMKKQKNLQIWNEPPNAQGVAPSKKDMTIYSKKKHIYIYRFDFRFDFKQTRPMGWLRLVGSLIS